MKQKTLAELTNDAYEEGKRLVAPILGFPGIEIIGSNVKRTQQNHFTHYSALKVLYSQYHPDAVFPVMDLTIEASALGRYTDFPVNDSATVLTTDFSPKDIERLREIDITGDCRIHSIVETVKLMLVGLPKEVIKGAYVSGPYTLAGQIMGVENAGMACMENKSLLHDLCELATDKIQRYIHILTSAGTDLGAICILEPSATMLSPDLFEEFSGNYISKIVQSYNGIGLNFIYHTCGNTNHLVEKMAQTGVNALSLDSPQCKVDLEEVAHRIPSNVVVMGNINPTGNLLTGNPEEVRWEVYNLLHKMDQHKNFILSTGCDIPQQTPLRNIEAFMSAGRDYRIGD